jgi:hypothetical protein
MLLGEAKLNEWCLRSFDDYLLQNTKLNVWSTVCVFV